ncbi:GP88 family protein [Nonomuraea sp. SYSU D8015]|uniref:GP88 family protein n=1 Tax=Nonomuraea sp. SYSU D8015 TaxID=2593644 RepID=UPI001660CDE3|nr:hypothetical protein [Nonomuraea sp. SYSU D8015]
MSFELNLHFQLDLFDQKPPDHVVERPSKLLTQNSQLRQEGIWNWTLPALYAKLPDGRKIITCPSAGKCAVICYARFGAYRFRQVRERHLANLAFVVEDLSGWEQAMTTELRARRFQGKWIRIHDSGDFFSDDYLSAWLRISRTHPKVKFYAYTKEVERFRRLVEPNPPPNFFWVYSLGGKYDADLDVAVDRIADVFPTREAIRERGWHDQEASDLLSVTGASPVGMACNRIPTAIRRLGDRTLGDWQRESDRKAADRKRST